MPQPARLLDVGNCNPDHSMIRQMLTENFDVTIDRVMFVKDALEKMRANRYDLVLFNRLVFDDSSEGIELLRMAKAKPDLAGTPMMMISNFAESQAASVSAGGVPGFGKASVQSPTTLDLLSKYLPRRANAR